MVRVSKKKCISKQNLPVSGRPQIQPVTCHVPGSAPCACGAGAGWEPWQGGRLAQEKLRRGDALTSQQGDPFFSPSQISTPQACMAAGCVLLGTPLLSGLAAFLRQKGFANLPHSIPEPQGQKLGLCHHPLHSACSFKALLPWYWNADRRS